MNIQIAIPVVSRKLFIQDTSYPDRLFDTDEQMVAYAKELGATHLRFPQDARGGLLLMLEPERFTIVARWGYMRDGRLFVNNYWGGLYYPLEGDNLLTEL